MSKLSKRQMAVIDDLFDAADDEAEVLAKHHVSGYLYRRWLANETFCDELNFRIESAKRQSRHIIARYAPMAAAKLIELVASDKEETCRKACLEIIALQAGQQSPTMESAAKAEEDMPKLSAETASRLLAALAQEDCLEVTHL